MLIRPFQALFGGPLIRRIGFHARRITGEMDRHFFVTLLSAVIGFVVVAAVVTRDGRSLTNPPTDFRLQAGDDAVVVAEGLGELRPLELRHD